MGINKLSHWKNNIAIYKYDWSDFMPNLICNVSTCGHNKSNLCCKEGIVVGGENAFTSDKTCCESFTEKTKDFLNSTEEPKASMNVSCEAKSCTYNELGMCGAEAISIAGGPVSSSAKTECNSFVPKF